MISRFLPGILLITLLLSFASVHSQAQIGEPNVPKDTDLTAHPRLLLTDAYIETVLQPRAEQETITWLNLLAYVNSEQPEDDFATANHVDEATRALAVAYLVTGERAYAERAKDGLVQMVGDLQSHPAMAHYLKWDMDFVDLLTGIAVNYDWLYDSLVPSDRTALAEMMLEAAKILNDPQKDENRVYIQTDDETYRLAAFEADTARVLWAVTAVAMALRGEHPEAPDLIDYIRTLYNGWVLPALDDIGGGSWSGGQESNFLAGRALIQMTAAWWTALGENYFDNTSWFYDHLPYQMFLSYPGLQHVSNQPDKAAFRGYPAIFGDSARYSSAALYGRGNDLLLAQIFTGTRHAGWMNWFTTQKGASLQGAFAVDEFLWRDKIAEGFPPPWTMWYTLETGHIFLRSTWTDEVGNLDSEAVYLAMNAGDHYSRNQFYDTGNLVITRGSDELLVRSGVYSGGQNSDHDVNYYGRTIAANTILVCDIAENFDHIRPNDERETWLNDCGQRPMSTGLPTAINSFFKAENAASYETGNILRFAEEGSMNYYRLDLTPAYNNLTFYTAGNRPKVREVLREVVYIRPGTVVIHDRVIPAGQDFVVFDMFHFNKEPILQPDEQWQRVQAGNSSLYFTGVVPNNREEIIEGYAVAGEEIPPVYNHFETEPYGQWRVQYIPEDSSSTYHFLTLFSVGDEFAANPGKRDYAAGEGVYGVIFDDWQMMFDDDPGNITRASFDTSPDIHNVLIVGLEPLAQYQVNLPDGTRTSLQADSAGTLSIYSGQAGTLSLHIQQ